MDYYDNCIATSSDSNYFPALIGFLNSVKKTNPDLPVIVFDGGLTRRQAARAARLSTVIKKDPFYDLKGRGKFSYIGNTTLLKLHVEEINCGKVLYLDVDMIVLEDLSELFSFPKGKVGVVREVNSVKNMFRLRDREKLMRQLDLEWNDIGFNAGLFVLRPAEWSGLKQKAMLLIDRFGDDVFSKTKDQQLLNIIFSGQTYDFPGRYNFSPLYDDPVCCPAIIHYLSKIKPWQAEYPLDDYYQVYRKNLTILDFPSIIGVDIERFFRNIRGNK